MNQSYDEQLSALCDDELQGSEARFLLRRVGSEPALAKRWERFHLVRIVLRRQELAPLAPGFAEAVMARIAQESAPAYQRRWLKPVLGGAIAAGVAAIALVAVAPQRPGAPTAPQELPSLASTMSVRTQDLQPTIYAQPAAYSTSSLEAPTFQASPVEAYLLRHSNATLSGARGGFVPYVYVVATPSASPAPRPQSPTPTP
ncbi:MAG TPA: sigma-E factor negative regulatory protein [Xanthomonadales bacterium]|nr:sigma-E factor negative regulatory protein [Xanthomonadales bacterium]